MMVSVHVSDTADVLGESPESVAPAAPASVSADAQGGGGNGATNAQVNAEANPEGAAAPRQRRDPTIHAARHAIEVLRCISQARPEIGVSEIARRVGMHKSSVSRLISTLEAQHVVERNRDTDRVSLGTGLLAIAAPLMAKVGISQASRLRMAKLAEDSAETVNLSVWDGREGVSVDQTLGPNAITHFAAPGQANPAHCTAAGKVLLAFSSAADIKLVLSGELGRYTEHTITDAEKLREQIEQIRRDGFAVNHGEFSAEAGAVAALVRDIHGYPSAALTITVPMYRFGEDRERALLALVREAANDISGQILLPNSGR